MLGFLGTVVGMVFAFDDIEKRVIFLQLLLQEV